MGGPTSYCEAENLGSEFAVLTKEGGNFEVHLASLLMRKILFHCARPWEGCALHSGCSPQLPLPLCLSEITLPSAAAKAFIQNNSAFGLWSQFLSFDCFLFLFFSSSFEHISPHLWAFNVQAAAQPDPNEGKKIWYLTNCLLASKPLHDEFMYLVLVFCSYVMLHSVPVLLLDYYSLRRDHRNKL